MTSSDAVTQVLDVLEAIGIPYMIVGSLASTQYGISRSTKDADIVVELGAQPVSVITKRLSPSFQCGSTGDVRDRGRHDSASC